MPIVELKNTNHQVSLKEYGMYNVQNTFNPGEKGPGSDSLITNTESLLRNVRLTKIRSICLCSFFNSDLYNVKVTKTSSTSS